MNVPLDWLLEGDPWIAYRARLDLLGQAESDEDVQACRQAMLADQRVRALVDGLSNWPGTVISSHKSAGQPFHRLTFAADLGLKNNDPGMEPIIQRIFAHQSAEGPFQLTANISTSYGGEGKDTWGWALCDAPLVVYALIKFGLEDTQQVQRALQHLVGLVRHNGWPCAVSQELGSFRGPGRKEDPCPFANLAMLKALEVSAGYHASPASRCGAETLLSLWHESLQRHPYIFYMGTDFRKLKVPFIWYDLAHVLEVLSQFEWLRTDARLLEMADLLTGKMDSQGRFTNESVWAYWKDWEFGQKRLPS
ncbi:MAG: hypothetical protein MUC85_02650, partial [Anaerolineales bacterium]|nr:hypothetical protein [Anaerolineales bacterium]